MSKSMACPKCRCFDLELLETRKLKTTIRRRRKCNLCKYRWTTHEKIVTLKQPEPEPTVEEEMEEFWVPIYTDTDPMIISFNNSANTAEKYKLGDIDLRLNREAAACLIAALALALGSGKAEVQILNLRREDVNISISIGKEPSKGLIELMRGEDEEPTSLPE